jgi:hypothetical protein
VDGEAAKLVVIIGILGALALWVLSTFVWRMAGTWQRVLTDEEIDEGQRAERVTLAQLGPFVTGRRDVRGGFQEYSGLAFGWTVSLTRRDHGQEALEAMGFPEGVAKKLSGEVMAKLKLTLVDGVELRGTFEPMKVEFTHQPPRVTAMFPLPKKPRTYRKVEGVLDRVPKFDEAESEVG